VVPGPQGRCLGRGNVLTFTSGMAPEGGRRSEWGALKKSQGKKQLGLLDLNPGWEGLKKREEEKYG